MKLKLLFLFFFFFDLNAMFPNGNLRHKRTKSHQFFSSYINILDKRIQIAEETGVLNLDPAGFPDDPVQEDEDCFISDNVSPGFDEDEFSGLWNIAFRCNGIKPLIKLILSNNEFDQINEQIIELKFLEVLDLRNIYNLQFLPECLGNMDSLKTIYIKGTRIIIDSLPENIKYKCDCET